jgi:hypothetical protein
MKFTKQLRLKLDEWAGEGEIAIAEGWEENDALWRADILKDWIYELTELYSDALIDMGRKNATGVEFIEVTEEYIQVMYGCNG